MTGVIHRYHFHAISNSDEGGTLHFDGLLEMSTPIDSIERYFSAKQKICKAFDEAPDDHSDLIICSLTPLSYGPVM